MTEAGTLRNDEWLTPDEVSAMSKLAKSTLKDLRWKGAGPAFTKLSPGRSGRVRYLRSSVESWLAGGH